MSAEDWRAADADAGLAATGGEGTGAASNAPADAVTTPSAGTDAQRAAQVNGGGTQHPQAGSTCSTPQSLVKQTAQRQQAHSQTTIRQHQRFRFRNC